MKNQNEYATKKAFHVYRSYIALKLHFTTNSYDYFKYEGRVKLKSKAFKESNDAYFYYKLSKCDHLGDLLLSNIVDNPNRYIGEISSGEGELIYLRWKKIIDGFDYRFEQDVKKLSDNVQEAFFIENEYSTPDSVMLMFSKEISVESMAVLTKILGVNEYWSNQSHFMINDLNKKLIKYQPFLNSLVTPNIKQIIRHKWFK